MGGELYGMPRSIPVSYTHLDVYKRQALHCVNIIQEHVIDVLEDCDGTNKLHTYTKICHIKLPHAKIDYNSETNHRTQMTSQ